MPKATDMIFLPVSRMEKTTLFFFSVAGTGRGCLAWMGVAKRSRALLLIIQYRPDVCFVVTRLYSHRALLIGQPVFIRPSGSKVKLSDAFIIGCFMYAVRP